MAALLENANVQAAERVAIQSIKLSQYKVQIRQYAGVEEVKVPV